MYLRLVLFYAFISFINSAPSVGPRSAPSAQTSIKTKEVRGSIAYKILEKPHHLFIGRCKPDDNVLHQENIILYNDGKSHVAAGIRVNVEAEVYITCVKIYDEVPDGAGGYPSYVAGGVGHNYVEFNVMTEYGKGFHFFVQIFGYDKKNDIMYRLFSLSALLLFVSADPRTPKIYNVLISTKKNLSPSHALPVYEPVLRTTSLGIALPPFFYQPPITFEPNFVARTQPLENVGKEEKSEGNRELQKSLQPLPVEQFIPYTYTPHLLNNGYFTQINQQNEGQNRQKVLTNPEELYQKSDDPKHVIANLRRNSNIPDVPPPALPTRTS